MIALVAWWAFAADRAEIGLLPVDAPPGTQGRDTRLLVRGLAAALEDEGRYRGVFDAELDARVSRGFEDRLRTAQDAYAEGRRLLAAGDIGFARVFLTESTQAWGEVGAGIAWRAPSADAWYQLARAALAEGDRPAAEQALSNAITLVPDYVASSADADPAVAELVPDVIGAMTIVPRLSLSGAGASAIEQRVGTPYLVSGRVDDDGSLALTVWAGASVVHTVTRRGPFRVGSVGDPWYADMANEVAAAAWGDPIPVARVLRPADPIDGPGSDHDRPRWVLPVVGSVALGGIATGLGVLLWPAPDPEPSTWTLRVYPAP